VKASWRRLRLTFEWLLNHPTPSKLNPTNVLNFVTSYLYHPRSWAGFIKTEHETFIPSIYQFNPNTACKITNYILSEGKAIQHLDETRFELLLYATRQNITNIYAVVLYLKDVSETAASSTIRTQSCELLLYLYYAYPNIVNSLCQDYAKKIMSLEVSCSQNKVLSFGFLSTDWLTLLKFDAYIHRLIKLLMDIEVFLTKCALIQHFTKTSIQGWTPRVRTFEKHFSRAPRVDGSIRLHFSRVIARYLKRSIVVWLFLRRFPGRSYIEQEEFEERNYDKLFLYVLEVVHSLKPYVYKVRTYNNICPEG